MSDNWFVELVRSLSIHTVDQKHESYVVLVCYRLYSCLANGSADEFQKGDHLYKARAVKDVLQIGK